MKKRVRKGLRGQSTIEYLLMVAFGAIFSLQLAKFFNDIFREGLVGLEQNIGAESQTGKGFSQ
jgi:type II secretory pathway component PulJ